MKNRESVIGAIAVILASIMWGFDGIVLTPRLYNLDVIFVVFMLHLIPFVIMNLFLSRQYRHLKVFSYQDVFVLFLIAMFGGILGTVSIVKALFLVNFKSLTVVVLLQKLQPVFSIILAAIILRERIRKRFALWAGLAIVASYFLVFGFKIPLIDTSHTTAEAALFALLAAFAFGSSTVLSKQILRKYEFSTGTFYRYGFTSIILLLVVLISGRVSQFGEITVTNWIFFLIIAFTTGSGAIFLYYFGLIRIRAVVATMCELFFPLSAIVFDYLFNGKILNPVQWVAAVIMIFAIIRLSANK
jgi:drug/metabolite transporter (DMT)-like permease